ncbi:MAG: flagellar motor switch protein FliN [Bdellovibrionales bacterium]|nr:flagellar motor switch protein FliN [Bdellovibrionales bacterium]
MSEDGNAAENLDLDAAESLAAALADDDETEETPQAAGGDAGSGAKASKNNSDDDDDDGDEQDRNLELILDVPLKVTVELGRTKMVVSELLNLGQGSVVELNKLAGEPMELLVNEKLVARGEAVVVNEKFGIRLTDILSQSERVEKLA